MLELPDAFRYRIRFERIPNYDLHAKGFFANMTRSGLVTLLVDDDSGMDGAFLEVVEPIDGEVFRISVEEFVAYAHKDGVIESPEDKELFLLDAMSAYGLLLERRDKGEFDEVAATVVTEAGFDSFFPEAMPAA
ncbi:MAG: hypothetical protein QMC36_01020 [Patescibacteria group bacterium]